jgi:hypothetical protein
MTFIIRILQAPIRLYQRAVSPFLAPSCRFAPTCSHYALQALEKHGAIKGAFLAFCRILRCHPYHRSALFHDPVPESCDWRIDWPGMFRYNRMIHRQPPEQKGSNPP